MRVRTVVERGPKDKRSVLTRRTLGAATPTYHLRMCLDALEFLDEERDAWLPFEALLPCRCIR